MRVDLDYEGELPEGWTILEAVVVAKCLDEEGRPALLNRASLGLSSWEAIGMVVCIQDRLREAMRPEDDGADG